MTFLSFALQDRRSNERPFVVRNEKCFTLVGIDIATNGQICMQKRFAYALTAGLLSSGAPAGLWASGSPESSLTAGCHRCDAALATNAPLTCMWAPRPRSSLGCLATFWAARSTSFRNCPRPIRSPAC
jgi:hypothetical protein